MSIFFVFLLVVGEFVECGLIFGFVVVADGRFLGSGLVGGVGRTSALAFCCGVCCWGRVRLLDWCLGMLVVVLG